MKPKVKLSFLDTYREYDRDDNIIVNTLRDCCDVEWSDDPDYIIYSVFSDDNILADHRAVKIFYTGENLAPDFNLCDYAIASEIMTFGDRYFRLPFFYRGENRCRLMEGRAERVGNAPSDSRYTGRKFCNFIYSNGSANHMREDFFRYLNENYKTVDSGGRYLNNVGGPCSDKGEFQRQYKFTIAFENTSHPGYTTEKIVDAFAADTIPVYWGDPCITDTFDPDSFILVKSEEDFPKALARIRELDEDPVSYMEMLKKNPLIRKEDSYDETVKRLSGFLKHIISQPKEEAYRRNMEYWGKMYRERQQAYVKALRFKKKYINPVSGAVRKIIPGGGKRS
ncbi:MAG: hypothetical protein K6E33_06810 [Lachnospiraceae bacterium]|nr:hypothetical protein [Lachnospiraceae bacterium]